jgi:hypothetical protein
MKQDWDIRTSTQFERGEIYTWAEVNQLHRVWIGVYQKNGRLVSLLTDFGKINPCYPDQHGGSHRTIIYTGNGRHGDQKLDPQNRALLNAVGTDTAFPLFNKTSPNRWEYLGEWRVLSATHEYDDRQERMLWRFVLRAEPE